MTLKLTNLLASTALAFALSVPASSVYAGGHTQGEMDHSQHQMGGDKKEGHDMSAGGHEGHDMGAGGMMKHGDHVMTPEMMDELRSKISLFENYSDQEIALSMQMMGANYPYYVSDSAISGETGVLLLAHGFGERGDKVFAERLGGLSGIFPTSVSYGMSMMGSGHIQTSVDALVEKGAKRIVVVPVVSSTDNTMYRQWEYIFGKRDEASYLAVPQIETEAEILMSTAIDDNPLVADILLDNLDELSEDPSKETVIIVAHGPEGEEDNVKALEMLSNVAMIVEQDGGYAEVTGMTLQDDAAPEVRKANVQKLRDKVAEETAAGNKVLIVSNLMSARSIQHKMRKDLQGLDYEFSNKGLVQHDDFIKWVEETVRYKLEDAS